MVQDGPTFEKALKALDLTGVTVVHVLRPCEGIRAFLEKRKPVYIKR
jgi:feruloyl-CoA synthase